LGADAQEVVLCAARTDVRIVGITGVAITGVAIVGITGVARARIARVGTIAEPGLAVIITQQVRAEVDWVVHLATGGCSEQERQEAYGDHPQ
jgi:hypothetical protein